MSYADHKPNQPKRADERECSTFPLQSYRALHLMHSLGVRPELATMLAALAFGGGR